MIGVEVLASSWLLLRQELYLRERRLEQRCGEAVFLSFDEIMTKKENLKAS